jgi:hypothetical protein
MIIINFVDLIKFMLEHWSNYLGVLLFLLMCWFLLMTTVNALLDKLIDGAIGVVVAFKHEKDEEN